jgi:hypothetical protein
MAGYLDAYGVADAKRERTVRGLLLTAVALVIVGIVVYFLARDYREQQKIKSFLALLRNQDYQAAYGLWGCSEKSPCPQYPFKNFMEDWGPQSPHANIAAAKLGVKKSCEGGIIQFVEFPGKEEVQLWVERSNQTIGFAPWPVCNPRMQAP